MIDTQRKKERKSERERDLRVELCVVNQRASKQSPPPPSQQVKMATVRNSGVHGVKKDEDDSSKIRIRFIVMDYASHKTWVEGYQRYLEKQQQQQQYPFLMSRQRDTKP